jgi:hypothetical protein
MLPSRADDLALQQLVRVIFAPSDPWQPGDPVLVQQLLNHAPQPTKVGVDDWNRPLRADEVAEVWGAPMEGPYVRRTWLLRADEVARAWGQPLFGEGGLAPDKTVED